MQPGAAFGRSPAETYVVGDSGPFHNRVNTDHSTNVVFLDGHVKLAGRWESLRGR